MKWLWSASKKQTTKNRTADSDRKNSILLYGRLFFLGALLYLAAVLPFILYRGGIFFYYGDYNVQQVPFYILAHRAVRDGTFFWNFKVDLGSSMGGSFAFYLWGSPFFWFSCLFPEKWIPYMMPLFMSMKYGTALCTSFAWLSTMTRTRRGALLGALLYTFSGFAACNIVFQHFHEAVAFFPLFLLTLDRFHQKFHSHQEFHSEFYPKQSAEGGTSRCRKEALLAFVSFSFVTAGMAVVNYFFFFGEVLFLALYYLIRYSRTQKLSQTFLEILRLILAGALGLCLAAFFLIQVVDTVFGNTRLSDLLLGYNMVAYSEPTTPLAILKSMFFLPDLVGRGTLFTSEQIRNSSLSLFLPCFAVSGVIAYLRSQKKGWMRTLLLSCLVIAFVPILNSAFALFNAEYYARWFYMPILMISLVTVRELEDADQDNLRFGTAVVFLADALLVLCSLLPTAASEEPGSAPVFFEIMEYPELFVTEAVVTFVMLPMLLVIVHGVRLHPHRRPAAPELPSHGLITRTALVLSVICCLLTQMGVLWNGSSLIAQSGGEKWRSQLLENRPEIPGYGEAALERVEADSTSTNYEMVWGYPTIHCFESTVSPGIFRFYEGIGPGRTVDSKLNLTHVGARAILSLHYYLENTLVHSDKSYSEQGGLPGYQKAGESDGFAIYENQYFIPVGFTFDRFMTEDTYALILDRDKSAADRFLVRDLILDDDAAGRYGDLFLQQDTSLSEDPLSQSEYFAECRSRAASACTSFTIQKSGFTAETALDRENLVFFSFPYEKGWTAKVDGQKADIVQADYGLMAVDVPAGTHTVTFTYLPYGFYPAVLVSLSSLLVLSLLLVYAFHLNHLKGQKAAAANR